MTPCRATRRVRPSSTLRGSPTLADDSLRPTPTADSLRTPPSPSTRARPPPPVACPFFAPETMGVGPGDRMDRALAPSLNRPSRLATQPGWPSAAPGSLCSASGGLLGSAAPGSLCAASGGLPGSAAPGAVGSNGPERLGWGEADEPSAGGGGGGDSDGAGPGPPASSGEAPACGSAPCPCPWLGATELSTGSPVPGCSAWLECAPRRRKDGNESFMASSLSSH